MKNRLTDKQRAFIDHYLAFGTETFFNATQSARAAGYKGNNHTLRSVGCENLTKPNIRQHIQVGLAERGANPNELIHRWLTVTRVDISPHVTPGGLDVEALKAAGLGWLIKGVRVTRDSTVFLLRDPEKAEEQLAKALSMFVNVHEVTVDVGERVARALYGEL